MYPFKGKFGHGERTVEADRKIFYMWLKRQISTKEAAREIAVNNRAYVMSEDEFRKVAWSLNYKRRD